MNKAKSKRQSSLSAHRQAEERSSLHKAWEKLNQCRHTERSETESKYLVQSGGAADYSIVAGFTEAVPQHPRCKRGRVVIKLLKQVRPAYRRQA